MKPNVFLALVFLSLPLAAACRLPLASKTLVIGVKEEGPGVSVLPAGLFSEIVVTDFRDDAPSPDFALGRELQSYLAAELRRSFKGTVSHMDLFRDGEAAASGPAFWKQAAAGRERAVFLTGSAGLVGRTLKALKKKKLPADGPFNLDRRGLIEQRRWTLSVDLSVVSAATGETLYKIAFREERRYIDLDKPAEFAFAELADRIRDRLFPILFGAPTIEAGPPLRRCPGSSAKRVKTNGFPRPAGASPGTPFRPFFESAKDLRKRFSGAAERRLPRWPRNAVFP
jgi:hypothetical protein